MSIPVYGEPAARAAGLGRAEVRLCIGIARVLTYVRPLVLRTVLRLAARGARPSTYQEALSARLEVCGASDRCAGLGCLQRSIAVYLLCRRRGSTPDWVSGFTTEPFVAHAWVEVRGAPVGEPESISRYRVVLEVRHPTAKSPAADR